MLFPMPIIIGAPRSGTTLLRLMLDAHPDLAIPPETGFLALSSNWINNSDFSPRELVESISTYPTDAPTWPDFGISQEYLYNLIIKSGNFDIPSGIRTFYQVYAERFGKPRYGDKTPGYCYHLAAIHELLPETRFIHIIRDGRDVALSWRKTWFAPSQSMHGLAKAWKSSLESVQYQTRNNKLPVLEIHYENLIRNTRSTLQEICDFIELLFNDSMLTYYQTATKRLAEHGCRKNVDGNILVSRSQRLSQQALVTTPPALNRVNVWKNALGSDEIDEFEAVAGELLKSLGYEVKNK